MARGKRTYRGRIIDKLVGKPPQKIFRNKLEATKHYTKDRKTSLKAGEYPCHVCYGSGENSTESIRRCSKCGGNGIIKKKEFDKNYKNMGDEHHLKYTEWAKRADAIRQAIKKLSDDEIQILFNKANSC